MPESPASPTIAITGAAGYIGSRVLRILQDTHPEWEYVALDNFTAGQVATVGDVEIADIDVRERAALETGLAGCDVVAHLAAVSGVDDCEAEPDEAYESNVVGTANVAWFCRKTGAGLVFPYSMAVVGDPVAFPITVDHPRDPLNWYGRTKLLGERTIETLADGEFPAHMLMKSNLYGDHVVDGTRVTKGTVINFFVDRALAGEPLTVYEPGTQSRNFVHVTDVARAYVASVERLLTQRRRGETGTWGYEIASDQDPSVREVADLVSEIATEELGRDVPVELVENPRAGETLVDEFAVDTSRTAAELDWRPVETVEQTVVELFRER